MSLVKYSHVPTSTRDYLADIEIETAAEISTMSNMEHNLLRNLDFENSGHIGFAGIKIHDTEYWDNMGTSVFGAGILLIYTDYFETEENVFSPGLKITDGIKTVSELPFVSANTSTIEALIQLESERAIAAENILQGNIDAAGHKISATIIDDLLTIELLDTGDTIISTTQVHIDIDTNKYIVSGIYNSESKKIIFTYNDGTTMEVDLSDLVNPLNSRLETIESDYLTSVDKAELEGEIQVINTDLTSHTSNKNNPHDVTKAQVGLGNVVNTSDSDIPIENGTTKFTTGGAYSLKTNLEGLISDEESRAKNAEDTLSQRVSTIENTGFITQDINTSSIAVQYAKSSSRTILSGNGDWAEEDVLNIEKTQLSCAYGNGYYISVGNEGSIVYSQDGIVWEKFNQQFTDRNLDKICFGNGYFLAICFETKTIYRAFSPTIWGVYTTLDDVIPTNLQYINNKFIITCDEGKLLLSDLGKTYNKVNMSTSLKINSVAYGNGYYVAVGDGGLIMISKDGVEWLNRSDNTFVDNYKNIIYTNGMFITHTNNLVRYSTNYYQFANAIIPEIIGYPINNIIYGESKYYVLCSALFGTKILESIDGKNYTLDYITGTILNSIYYGLDTFLCVGEIGHICILDLGIEWYYEKPVLGENEYLWARNVNYLNNGDPIYSLAYYMDYIDNTTNELENYYNIVTTDDLLNEKQDNINNITNTDIDILF